MALICKERFEQRKIDNLLDYLKLYADKGQAIDYEIIVDGFKAVRRTSDLEMFSLYENFVTGDTKYIEILLFAGSSNNNDKRIFYFGEDVKQSQPQPQEGLSGMEVQRLVEEGIQKATREMEFESLQKENKELLSAIRELEEDVEELTRQKQALEAKQSPLNSFLGDVGASVAESLIRRNPKIISALPGGEALAGLLQHDSTEGNGHEAPETQVSFKSKSDAVDTAYEPVLTESQQSAILFVDQLKAQFTKEEFDKVLIILQALGNDKNLIEEISSKYQVISTK